MTLPSIHFPTMTTHSAHFTGVIVADRDTEPGEEVELTEAVARRVFACLSSLPWEPQFKWRAKSAGTKKGETVTLETFEVWEGEG